MIERWPRPLAHILLTLIFVVAPLAKWPGDVGAQSPAPQTDSALENVSPDDVTYPPRPYWRKVNPKLESALSELAETAEAMGAPSALGLVPGKGLATDDGTVTVVLETEDGRASAIHELLAQVGAIEEGSYGNLVAARVPIERLKELAGDPIVRFVRRPMEPVHLFEPSTTSEGVGVVNATAWHAANLKGQNVKVAVLDSGFVGWQAKKASGELPANVIVRSFRSNGDVEAGSDHGTATAEIVYDMAPSAQLYLVNYGNEVELGTAVDWLASQGVKVISYSMGWFNAGPGDGTGIINDIVATARNNGILWVSSAGNHAQRHWEGTFNDSDGDGWHNFSVEDEGNSLYLTAGQQLFAFLSWDDWPYSTQDYDFYLVRSSTGQIVAGSETIQQGGQPPTEAISYPVEQSGVYGLLIGKLSASRSVYFELYTARHDLEYRSPRSSLLIPADSPNALAVGAVPYGSNSLESFSSQGPTNGSNPRTKPDLAAPDGVSTASYGTGGFYGTSASAPHVAGAAALVLGVYTSYTPAQVQSFIEGRGIDLGDGGKDDLFGSGRLNMGSVPGGILSISPSSLAYMSEISGTLPAPRTLRITNSGPSNLSWSALVNSSWITLSATSGSLTASSSATVTVSVSTTSLLTGTYNSSILFADSQQTQSVNVPVQLFLLPNGQLRRVYFPLVNNSYAGGW